MEGLLMQVVNDGAYFYSAGRYVLSTKTLTCPSTVQTLSPTACVCVILSNDVISGRVLLLQGASVSPPWRFYRTQPEILYRFVPGILISLAHWWERS